ncbi:MAG: acetolactate synthase large subunit [Deltaproteobacteria bacterium]|nr:acetolactate synthase large subunit [Deltaproteobacteria bacterium]
MKASDAIVRALENEGVRYVFGVPGEENEDLLFSLANSSIEFVACRHEQGAAFIANVWGRITGKAGVCLSTLGPGATNLLTGVADANLDKAPLVAITAQGSLTRLHHESHQCLNTIQMFAPVTKWNSAISSIDVITEVVRKAFKIAESEKPGATHIEISEDLARERYKNERSPLAPKVVRRPSPDYKAIKQTIELLREARRPLLIAGNGAIRKRASAHLTRFVRKHDLPVTSTFMGKGAVSDRFEQSLMTIGLGFAKDYVMQAVEASDLILSVGYDIAEFPPEKWNPKGDKRIVHIDFTAAEVYTHYDPEVEVVCDISGALWEIEQKLQECSLSFEKGWYRPVRERIMHSILARGLGDDDPFTIPGALNIIRDVLDDDGLLISDVGSHKIWIARNFPTFHPNGCIISNGLASMGIALPGAIAASLIDPNRQVVAAMGDGGFLFNSQELETAKRLGVAFTVIIFNDEDYGMISWKQKLSRGESVSTKITNPDFKAYAESFGIPAYRPRNLAQLREQLMSSIRSRKLSVIEVRVDPKVNHQLVQELDGYWKGANHASD